MNRERENIKKAGNTKTIMSILILIILNILAISLTRRKFVKAVGIAISSLALDKIPYIETVRTAEGIIAQGKTRYFDINIAIPDIPPYTFKLYRAEDFNATTGFVQIETTYICGENETSHQFIHLMKDMEIILSKEK